MATRFIGKDLSPSEWPIVQQNMLSADMAMRSAAVSLTPRFVTDPIAYLPHLGDISFSHQISELTDPSRANPVDCFVVTANSAVPVASAIRGYYAAAGTVEPFITHVKINRNTSESFYYGKNRDHYLFQYKDEIARLNTVLQGIGHAAVVDQFIGSGLTVKMSGALLHAAGVSTISEIRGCWYYGVQAEEINLNNLRCIDEPTNAFLFDVGQKAFTETHGGDAITTVHNANNA